MTTVREVLVRGWLTTANATCEHLGIDPDLDLDTHVLVAMPKCETCDGDGAISGHPHTPWEQCPTCKGTGTPGVPVILPPLVAEKLYEMLDVALVHGGRMYGGKPWPKATDDALTAYLEAQS